MLPNLGQALCPEVDKLDPRTVTFSLSEKSKRYMCHYVLGICNNSRTLVRLVYIGKCKKGWVRSRDVKRVGLARNRTGTGSSKSRTGLDRS